ncbi:hypothetical protein IAE22_33065, partial [Bacillus sp. S34]|nr:hypothetical protein [Bacillus sp. S34]
MTTITETIGPIIEPGPGLEALHRWVGDVAALTEPDQVTWCSGSDAENRALLAEMVASGSLIALADGHEFFSLGTYDISDDGTRLVYG